MAQELFKTGERTKQEELEQKTRTIMGIWQTYATEYRILPLKYLFLLEERKRLKLKLKKLSRSILNDYPEIPFFQILDRDEATVFVANLVEKGQIDVVLRRLEFVLSSDYSYNTLKNWVKETNYELSRLRYETAKKVALCQKSVALAAVS